MARYRGRFDPVHPCRLMSSRGCPEKYDAVCGERPCGRFEIDESDAEDVWSSELRHDRLDTLKTRD